MATNGTSATAASSRRASASATGPRSSTATRMNRNDAPQSAARVRSMRVWRRVMGVQRRKRARSEVPHARSLDAAGRAGPQRRLDAPQHPVDAVGLLVVEAALQGALVGAERIGAQARELIDAPAE